MADFDDLVEDGNASGNKYNSSAPKPTPGIVDSLPPERRGENLRNKFNSDIQNAEKLYTSGPSGYDIASKITDNPYLGTAIATGIDTATMIPSMVAGTVKNTAGHPPEAIKNIASEYAKTKGLNINHDVPKAPLNSEHSANIANAFEQMKHEPNNPQVKKSYNALINETVDQFNHIAKSGLQMEQIEKGQANPYKNSKDLLQDVHENGHLWYYPTEQGFGSQTTVTDHPLLTKTNLKDSNGKPLVANDVFRIVHDIFGHAKESHSFGPKGEENAWQTHMPMYSPEAQKALTTETRGQNSWVNFGPHGESNRSNPGSTIYADQKAGILPDFAHKIVKTSKPSYAEGGIVDFDSMQDDATSDDSMSGRFAVPKNGVPSFDSLQDDSEKYGTPGQQAIAGVEGLAKGIAGPLATAFERHVLEVPRADIKGREEANPITHGIGETAGLVGSSLLGTGEGALLSKAGDIAAAGTAGIKAAALRGTAEMAVLQSTDEVSKMIMNDPSVSAESAVSNIGLASAIGGATGLALGAVSPIWKATVGKRIAPVLEDIKGRLDFHLNNPDMVSASQKELQGIHTNVSDTIQKLYSEAEGGIRGEQIAKAMPELTEKATAKIDQHMSDINNMVEGTIDKMSKDIKVQSKVPYLQQDLEKFQNIASNPEASYIEKFNAVDDLKKTFQSYSKYGASVEDSAFSSITKKLAADIRPTLENPEIWGKAATIQKDINKAISEFIPAQKDMMSKFTTQLAGERVIDPSKVSTYINQLGKPQAEIKQEMMKNYLNKSSDLINTVNEIFTSKGLEAPFPHTSTAVLSDTIGEKSTGAHMVDKIIRDNLKDVLGKSAAGALGAAVGSHVGQPVIGALIGEHLLGPVFKTMIPGLSKPLLEMPSSINGLKSALEYGVAVAKGEKALNKSVAAVLKPSMQVLATKAMPNQDHRDKLDGLISRAQKYPEQFMNNQTGHIGDYLPAHQGTLAMTTARATQYLQSLKPHEFKSSPLDKPIQPTKIEEARYNRALDIAQNPSIVLQHVKEGTILPSDIQDLNSMYPALYKRMSQKLSNELTSAVDDDIVIPYRTKIGVSLFLGQPMDTSMTPTSIQDAQLTHMPPPRANAGPQSQGSTKKGTSALGKYAKSYKTPLQAAEADKASRD